MGERIRLRMRSLNSSAVGMSESLGPILLAGGYWFSLIILQPIDNSIKSSSQVVMKLAPLGGIQPAKLAKIRLKVISDQLVSFVAGPQPDWLHKNLWITLDNLLYSTDYRENYTEPVPP